MNGSKIVVSASDLSTALGNFNRRYFAHTEEGNITINCAVEAPFAQLKARVTEFAEANGISTGDVAVQFIHRFNPATNQWFLTMVCCTISTGDDGCRMVDTESQFRCDITAQGIQECSLTEGRSYDEAYFNNIVYTEDDGQVFQRLDRTIFPNAVTYPWEARLASLCRDNGLDNDEEASIAFTSGSFETDITSTPQRALIAWPHTIIMYMKKGNTIYLGDNDPAMGLFHNNAADSGHTQPPFSSNFALQNAM